MPSLLDDTRLVAGNALSSTAIQAGSLIGPAIGGGLVPVTGAATAAFGIDAVSFAVSAASLALIPRRPAARAMAVNPAPATDSTARQAATRPEKPPTEPTRPARRAPHH